jgi:hypothetical protein
MSDQKTIEGIKKLLQKHQQSHLLAFLDQLDTDIGAGFAWANPAVGFSESRPMGG